MYREDPAVDRSILVVAFARRVLGFDARTGTIRWELEIAQSGWAIELAIHRGHVYACGGKQLSCIDYATGRLVGEVQLPVTYMGRPSMVVQDDLIYVAGEGEVICLDLAGRVLWHDPLKGRGVARMALGFPGNVRQMDDAGSR